MARNRRNGTKPKWFFSLLKMIHKLYLVATHSAASKIENFATSLSFGVGASRDDVRLEKSRMEAIETRTDGLTTGGRR